MSSPVVIGSYEEPRAGDRVGLLVDPASGTEYSTIGVVKRVQRNAAGDLAVLVRWDGGRCPTTDRGIVPWIDCHLADRLIVIEEAS